MLIPMIKVQGYCAALLYLDAAYIQGNGLHWPVCLSSPYTFFLLPLIFLPFPHYLHPWINAEKVWGRMGGREGPNYKVYHKKSVQSGAHLEFIVSFLYSLASTAL